MDGGQSWKPDRALAVDWSASSRPTTGANSIWLGAAARDRPTAVHNVATRREAERRIGDAIGESIASGSRLLIGCDAGLGYPAGSAAAFGALDAGRNDIEPWGALWSLIEAEIVDDDTNRNNRFEVAGRLNAVAQRRGIPGPFWGAPDGATSTTLTRTKPRTAAPAALDEFRLAERQLRATGSRPHSMWQLLGAGSVGSQSLTLIPILERLRRDHPEVAIWPYEHDRLVTDRASVMIAEMWPTMFGFDEAIASQLCRDAAQVHRLAEVALDRGGGWLAVPEHAPASTLVEEGWVLGVEWPTPDRLAGLGVGS